MIVPDGMHDPEVIDPPDQPFSYYATPTDLLGAMYAPVGCEVTPEGYIFTGFSELMFFTGNPPVPVNCRIKTLHRDVLPIIEYSFERDGVRYGYQMFAADLGGALAGVPLNFARVTVTNCSAEPRTAYVSAACRYHGPSNMAYPSPGDYRFGQRGALLPPELLAGQEFPEPTQRYTFAADAVLRNGRLVYTFPAEPAPHRRTVTLMDTGLRRRRYFSGEEEGECDPAHTVGPDQPAGVVTHRLSLAPGQSQSLVHKLPIVPLEVDSPAGELVRHADYGEHLQQTITYWQEKVLNPAPLRLPEKKVQDYLLANTITNLLHFDRVGEDLYPTVNKFQYHSWFGGGNTNDIMASLEFMGHLADCREGLRFLLRRQATDGSFRLEHHPEGMWWEMWGYNLWGLARYYRLTRDQGFLQEVYPGVVRAMAWQAEVTAADDCGLWPPATIADDAYLKDCRQTGQVMWGLVGLRGAVALARAMGATEDAQRFQAQHDRFRAAFETALARQTARTGGYICPGLERTTLGNDWDNLLLLYPEVLFDPHDDRVTRTLEVVRGKYQEGVLPFILPLAIDRQGDAFTYNDQPGLHYWQTPNNTQSSLVRGTPADQKWALRELYAMLLHTSSTHMTAEFGTMPWGTREYSHVQNLIPQGTSAAKTIQALRNMLLREQEADLHLLSALSPEWLRPGQTIRVQDAPSAFGPLSFHVQAEADRLIVRLPQTFRNAPRQVWVRLPWCWELSGTEVDGAEVTPEGNQVQVLGARELVLCGRLTEADEPFSYEAVVAWYKAEYRRRYQRFLRTGERE